MLNIIVFAQILVESQNYQEQSACSEKFQGHKLSTNKIS